MTNRSSEVTNRSSEVTNRQSGVTDLSCGGGESEGGDRGEDIRGLRVEEMVELYCGRWDTDGRLPISHPYSKGKLQGYHMIIQMSRVNTFSQCL